MLKFSCRNLLSKTLKKPPTFFSPPQYSFSKRKEKAELNLSHKDHKFFQQFRSAYLLDDVQIFKFFRNQSFFEYMNQNFRILPFLLDPKKINKFRDSFDQNKAFQDHINNWFQNSQQERSHLIGQFPTSQTMSKKRIAILKPFIELYIDYLEQAFPQELEISVSLSTKTDLRMPHEWFPQARKMKRKIVYHHGPTNSGKTHSALENFENSGSGIYCSPLRLLAWEIHDRLEKRGVPCNLITGQERLVQENAEHVSCTIETTNLGELYNVAVIDEIQMIGNEERGAAWTNALLGLQASTIHLCGESRALSLVSKLCDITGDYLEERKYQRYSKIIVEDQPFRIDELQEGDCLITFSTKNVHKMKKQINEVNQEMYNSCAVIYGKLPPETRKEQAKRFNDINSNIKYLIATNAIGMGVNLKIRRVIFQTLIRMSSGGELVQIDENEIKQIAGRAGRFTETGLVTCMRQEDLRVVRRTLRNVNDDVRKDITVHGAVKIAAVSSLKSSADVETEEEFTFVQVEEKEEDQPKEEEDSGRRYTKLEKDIQKAGIFPQFPQIESFSKDLEKFETKKSTLSQIFQKFISISQIEDIYFIQKHDDFCFIAEMLEKCNLTQKDHYTFSCAPLSLNVEWKKAKKALVDFADQFGKFNNVPYPSVCLPNHPVFSKRTRTQADLSVLEEMHHILDIYLWLGQKFPEAFKEKEKVRETKRFICTFIDKTLEEMA